MTKAQQLENAVNFALAIAADNSHGYSNVVGQNLGPNDYDCGGLISAALNHVGLLSGQVFEPNEEYGNPWSWGTVLYPAGFKKLAFNIGSVRRGDILIKNGHHTELAINGYQTVGAHDNYDGRPGDWGTGNEISIAGISGGYWDYILRLDTGSDPAPTPSPTPATKYIAYCVQVDAVPPTWPNKDYLPEVHNYEDYAGIFGRDIIGLAMRLWNGAKLHYQVSLWDGDSEEWYGRYGADGWLPPVTGYDWGEPENGFAGDDRPVNKVMIWTDDPKIEVIYQVRGRKTGKWYEEVSSFKHNKNDDEYGYAGVDNEPIDALRARIVLH